MSHGKPPKHKQSGSGIATNSGAADASVNGTHQSQRPGSIGPQWGTVHLVAALAFGLIVGLIVGVAVMRPQGGMSSSGVAGATTLPSTAAPAMTGPVPAGPLDAHGRPPGDPHYGHNHP